MRAETDRQDVRARKISDEIALAAAAALSAGARGIVAPPRAMMYRRLIPHNDLAFRMHPQPAL